jgi:hypothetical protein
LSLDYAVMRTVALIIGRLDDNARIFGTGVASECDCKRFRKVATSEVDMVWVLGVATWDVVSIGWRYVAD